MTAFVRFMDWVLPGVSLSFTMICFGMIVDGLVGGPERLVSSGLTALFTACMLWFLTWVFGQLERQET